MGKVNVHQYVDVAKDGPSRICTEGLGKLSVCYIIIGSNDLGEIRSWYHLLRWQRGTVSALGWRRRSLSAKYSQRGMRYA